MIKFYQMKDEASMEKKLVEVVFNFFVHKLDTCMNILHSYASNKLVDGIHDCGHLQTRSGRHLITSLYLP